MEQKNINPNIVQISHLMIDYKMRTCDIRANEDVSLDIKRDKITALVGESGSGKSTLASALLNCLSEPGVITSGEVIFHSRDGQDIDITALNKKDLRNFRWSKVSMVFQGAQSTLNPVMTIYDQFKETVIDHQGHKSKQELLPLFNRVLKIVNLDPDRILKMYPHELSGGMRQRVIIAFALLLEPELMILDEPTTALDVITQDYVFSILAKINKEMHISMLLLTHDISIVAKYADYVGVMYGGKLMEYSDVFTIFKKRLHPYTEGLIGATPSLTMPLEKMHPIEGTPVDLMKVPEGCIFNPRCPKCMDICKKEKPKMEQIGPEHLIYCHLYKAEGGK
ncbi:MAG: ABC transporter ATP-binding protein [Bacilli bacterium]|jgi:peptide/nickel transport system ATP-binding protein|nr:ABC transporter ATP-binding protein [Bacilli bacterium]